MLCSGLPSSATYTISERVDLFGHGKLALLQDLELHGVLLGLGQAEPLGVLASAYELGQPVVEAVQIVDERKGNLRLDFLRALVYVVTRKNLVGRVDQV